MTDNTPLSEKEHTNIVGGYGDGCSFDYEDYNDDWFRKRDIKQALKDFKEDFNNTITLKRRTLPGYKGVSWWIDSYCYEETFERLIKKHFGSLADD